MEAEDMVQETYLRYQSTPPDSIQSHKAFLTTVVTRLCLDHLKSARVQRESYIGPWLPEPLLTGENTAMPTTDYDTISMAFLVLLENLNPVERAVFLLREVFDYEYAEIARIIGREEAACRQIFSRAKKHIADHRPRFKASPEEQTEIIGRFLEATNAGDMQGLMCLLAEDITWWSDGGGKVAAARHPLNGRELVTRFVLGLGRLAPEGLQVEIVSVNAAPAVILRDAGGSPLYVFTFEIGGGLIHRVRAVGNPDKLKRV
jgi:RNA polymerase sigma-70 factor (ECF subfamily)